MSLVFRILGLLNSFPGFVYQSSLATIPPNFLYLLAQNDKWMPTMSWRIGLVGISSSLGKHIPTNCTKSDVFYSIKKMSRKRSFVVCNERETQNDKETHTMIVKSPTPF
jgi:hypothetical protein